MSDELFGSTTSTQSVPQYVTDLGTEAAALAQQRNAQGYIPYYGPETAAFTPMQVAAMDGANLQAAALGLPTAAGSFPAPTDFGNGLWGYSSAGIMEDSLARLKAANPELYAMVMQLQQQQPTQSAAMSPAEYVAKIIMGGSDGEGTSTYTGVSGSSTGSNGLFGYTSPVDAINGGGPGTSGSTFSGAPVSNTLNTIGVSPYGSKK